MIYVIRRLIATIPVLIGVATITFFLLHLVPGDPVDIMLGDQASALDKTALRQDLGLDQPLARQFTIFASGLFKMDLGRSLHSKRPVFEEIIERIPATIELSCAAMAMALLIGIPCGVFAAIRKGQFTDRLCTLWSLIGMSVPGAWLGPMLIFVFAIRFNLLPVSERGGFENLILPSISLAIGLSAMLIQITRAAMIEVMKEDYLNVARAKGLHPVRVYFKHALRNALMPVLTVLGLQFGALLTGTVIIETIFDWPGIGTLLFQAIQQRNYPLVQGCVLFIAFIYVGVNLLTDLAYAYVNPRVRIA